MPALSLVELDRQLSLLETQLAGISSDLVELDNEPGKVFLEAGGLQGVTAQRWSEAKAALSVLWGYYNLLLEAATKARAARDAKARPSEAELGVLTGYLHTPQSFPKDPSDPDLGTVSYSVVQLVQLLSSKLEVAARCILEVTASRDAVLPALAELTVRVAALPESNRAKALSEELTRASRSFSGDPLGFDLASLTSTRERLTALEQEVQDQARLYATLEDRLEAAQATLKEVLRGWNEASRLEDQVAATLTRGFPHLSYDEGLAPELRLVLGLGPREQLAQLPRWEQRAARSAQEVTAHVTMLRGALEERSELKGLLSAYRAKALAGGFGEDPVLQGLAAAAEELLYTKPCDLGAARAAVRAFQDKLGTMKTPFKETIR